ncbi:hypothetical protein NE237_017247 [Protea cynaroides]|uniref:Uncharacterized protein n=1 Tax=Protea cynaroides TaxID=273540 RepID=A0A9Q0QMR4_9MAGN|nr:hypothetical protein NE237_017247 [Protea cynaroides]
METPASTRSEALTALNNIPTSRNREESEKKFLSRGRNLKSDRSALIDITNDSPIVGLARGSLESPFSFRKKRDRSNKTPGSGEALLRGQVKTLLQKVEEEAELSKLSLEDSPFLHLPAVVGSPSGLLSPTLVNKPQFLNLSCGGNLNNILNGSAFSSDLYGDSKILQGVIDINETNQEVEKSERSAMIRSLLMDFSEKSEIVDSSECSSELTYQEESESPEKAVEEDDASVWSIQVNASNKNECEEEVEEGEDAEADYYYYEEETEEKVGGELIDELCTGLSKISVQEKRMSEFKGKHTRFVYNSDEEIEGEETVSHYSSISPNVLRLKGLPTPEAKHLRFPQEEEED